MNTTRFLKIAIGAIVVVAVLVAFQAYTAKGSTKGNSSSPAGMGDLHRIEAGSSSVNSGALNGNRSSIGMGDLHRIEVQGNGRPSVSRPSAGFGDLHRLEAQAGSRPSAGMGDLHRFETR